MEDAIKSTDTSRDANASSELETHEADALAIGTYYMYRVAPYVRRLLSVVIAVGMTIVTSQYVQYAIHYWSAVDSAFFVRLTLVLAVTGYACYDLFIYDAVISAHLSRTMSPARAITLFLFDVAQVFVLGAMIQAIALIFPFTAVFRPHISNSIGENVFTFLLLATATWHSLIWIWHCIACEKLRWSVHGVLVIVYSAVAVFIIATSTIFDPVFIHWRAVIVIPLYAIVLTYLFFVRTKTIFQRAI